MFWRRSYLSICQRRRYRRCKKLSRNNANKYTFINLFSDHIKQIDQMESKHEKILKNQFGFQKSKSTVDCIFVLHSIITKTLANKKKMLCAFVDFEKCFDKIDRQHLFRKLITENLSLKNA